MFNRKKSRAVLNTERLTAYQKFGLFFFTKTRVTILLWMLIASFGVVSYTTLMQREGFPAVSAPYSSVSGTYFVNDREKVDREAARPIAEAAGKLDEVKQVSTQAGENFFGVQIEYKEGVKAEDGSRKVEEAVKNQGLLPKAAQAEFKPIYVSKLTLDGDDLLISVASPNLNAQQLQEKAELVAKELGQGGSVAVEGASRVRSVDSFRRGTDPATGQVRTEQRSFDWIATKNGEELVFTPSAMVAIQAKHGTDILELDDATRESLAKLQADARLEGVELHIAADFAESIRHQVGSLQENLIGGLLAVLLVSFLLISLRASLITALSMVTVLVMTVGALYLAGYTLNTITLFALILSLGLIVDDTIIMTEAIDKGRRSGAKAREVVATAIKRVALASTAGTLTTMVAFAPLLFVSGIMGGFIRAIPVTIIVSLAISLLISLTLIPFLARYTLLRGKPKASKNPISKIETSVARALANVVRQVGTSRKKGVVLGLGAILLSLIMLFAGGYFMGKLKFNIFPPTKDSDALIVDLQYAPGTTVPIAQRTSQQANQAVSSIDEYVTRVSYQGSGSESSSRMQIDLVSYKDREPTSHELAQTLQGELNKVSGLRAEVSAEAGPAPASGFTMQIRTEESDKAQQLAQAISQFLEGRELKRPNGTVAHLQEVEVGNPLSVQRTDGARYVEVNGKFDADDVSALVPLAQEAVKKEFPAERLQSQFGLDETSLKFDVGQEAQNQESFASMMIAFPILLVAMYLLLAFQFRSVSQPLMIFMAIPFSFFGVAAGLYFTDNSFSFFTMLAIFALLGIAVNNTILLTDYANQGRKRGLRRSEAMAVALEERFRPLLTTSLTSVVALIPLALSDPFWEALAVTLIFGLLSSTFLVIVAFPYYYLGNELIRSRFNRWKVLGWLVLLIVLVVAGAQLADAETARGIAVGYILSTFIALVVRALRKRRK